MQNSDLLSLSLIKKYEGFRELPYFATAEEEKRGLLTIGYGFTTIEGRPVRLVDRMPQETADKLLAIEISHLITQIKNLVKLNLSVNQQAALCSLVFNIGLPAFKSSTMLKHLQRGAFVSASREFNKWVYQAKKVVPGLVTRREEERRLFLKN